MVNAAVVNAESSYFSPATFCESFAVFGRIRCFRNPFKYTCGFLIYQDFGSIAASLPDSRQQTHLRLSLYINTIPTRRRA